MMKVVRKQCLKNFASPFICQNVHSMNVFLMRKQKFFLKIVDMAFFFLQKDQVAFNNTSSYEWKKDNTITPVNLRICAAQKDLAKRCKMFHFLCTSSIRSRKPKVVFFHFSYRIFLKYFARTFHQGRTLKLGGLQYYM